MINFLKTTFQRERESKIRFFKLFLRSPEEDLDFIWGKLVNGPTLSAKIPTQFITNVKYR
jgi:hypothetical protein